MKKINKYYIKLTNIIEFYPTRLFLLYSMVIFMCVLIIAFLRFPNNILQANFYAEDGRDFMAGVINNGLPKIVFRTFNGYFIVGLYLLSGMSYLVNVILFRGSFVMLPISNALVGYSFFAFCICLPAILLKKQLGYVWGTLLVFVTSLVPLISSDYSILGVVGNMKWLFYYLAFVLVIYRFFNYQKSIYKLLTIDLIFLICAYTNTTVYFLYPLLFLPYILDILRSEDRLKQLRIILKDKRVYQILLVGVLLLPQIIYIKIHGIPELPGYLDTPFDQSRLTELFVWRIYLYQFFYDTMKVFNDKLSLLYGAIIVVGLYFLSSKTNRIVVITSFYAIFITTFVFVLNRPGISTHLLGYRTSGPDQFFFVQNLIMWFITIFVLSQLKLSKYYKTLLIFLIAIVTTLSLPAISTFGKNNFMADRVGTFEANLKTECILNTKDLDKVSIQVYPEKIDYWKITVDREYACKDVD